MSCSGYRDTEKVRFLDQTPLVTKKHARQEAKAAVTAKDVLSSSRQSEQSSENARLLNGKSSNPTRVSAAGVIERPLLPSADDFAVSFFHGYYDCVPGLLTDSHAVGEGCALSACIRALGLATCANTEKSAVLNVQAKRNYVSALSKTNAALASPDEARQDRTLLAVLMLLHLEPLLSNGQQSFVAESAHMSGIAALLVLRGPAQFETTTGRFLFMQASFKLMYTCTTSGHRYPPQLLSLAEQAVKTVAYDSPERTSWILHRARLLLANLYSDVASGELEDPVSGVLEALSLDRDLNREFKRSNIASEWCSKRALTLQSWLAHQEWSCMIMCRTILHLLVVKVLRRSADHFNAAESLDPVAQNEASAAIIEELRLAALATTPRQTCFGNKNLQVSQAESRLYHLISKQANVPNAEPGTADQVLVFSLCGSGYLDTGHGDHPILGVPYGGDIAWALLLLGQLLHPVLYFRASARELLLYMGKDLSMQEAFTLADAWHGG